MFREMPDFQIYKLIIGVSEDQFSIHKLIAKCKNLIENEQT